MPDADVYARFVDDVSRFKPRLAIILGSGLAALTKTLAVASAVPYAKVSGLAPTSVEGHPGELLLVEWVRCPVPISSGRVHYYDGHPWRRVIEPVHVARRLGIESILITNAAGGIRSDLGPGSLMAIEAHLDCTRPFPWLRRSGAY